VELRVELTLELSWLASWSANCDYPLIVPFLAAKPTLGEPDWARSSLLTTRRLPGQQLQQWHTGLSHWAWLGRLHWLGKP
jgi:hypothetical protein